jgi:hypothetical protein
MDTTTARVLNTVKGGSTVPLKFEVFKGTTELTDVAVVNSLQYRVVNCATDASLTDPVETLATGGTALRYDATAGQFVYNWKTPTGSKVCYDVMLSTRDGSGIVAHFQLK